MKNAFLRTITPFSKNMGGCGGTVLRCLFTACPKRGRLGSPLCSCGLVHGHLRYSVVETQLHTQDRVRVEAVTAASVRGESRLGPRHPPRTSRPARGLGLRRAPAAPSGAVRQEAPASCRGPLGSRSQFGTLLLICMINGPFKCQAQS